MRHNAPFPANVRFLCLIEMPKFMLKSIVDGILAKHKTVFQAQHGWGCRYWRDTNSGAANRRLYPIFQFLRLWQHRVVGGYCLQMRAVA